jgi:hypothetical protein
VPFFIAFIAWFVAVVRFWLWKCGSALDAGDDLLAFTMHSRSFAEDASTVIFRLAAIQLQRSENIEGELHTAHTVLSETPVYIT